MKEIYTLHIVDVYRHLHLDCGCDTDFEFISDILTHIYKGKIKYEPLHRQLLLVGKLYECRDCLARDDVMLISGGQKDFPK